MIRTMTMEDFEEVHALWMGIHGFGIRSIDDAREGVERFLRRNPDTSVVAVEDGKIVGSILCGHDGRRGCFYHVCVAEQYRKRGIGKAMAIAAMENACRGHEKISVLPLKTKYPQGGERALISVVAGRHLRLGMLPADAGCVVDNVATVRAVYRAVCFNEPLMERGVTVSGDSVENPGNFWVKIGTGSQELVDACGGWKEGLEPEKILSGGPMMGIALSGLDVPVCKNNNAITALPVDPVAEEPVTACLRCGRCNRVCPLGLSPQLMQVAAQRRDYERYEKRLFGLECIACGCCSYICPAKRPLMQLFKVTKAEIMAAKKK